MTLIKLPIEIALGLMSWLFSIVVRMCMRVLTVLHSLRRIDDGNWRPIAGKMLQQPLSLLAVLTSAPRWNPHAVIGTAGPFRVRNSISFDIQQIRDAASSWSVTAYSFPWHRTCAIQGSLYPESTGTITLPPGYYMLACRYQDLHTNSKFVSISIDEQTRVEQMPIESDINSFYSTLAGRRNWLLIALNYYVYVLLGCKNYWPQNWIRRAYLPVGSQDTKFQFGRCETGSKIVVESSVGSLELQQVSLTVYDLASLPVYWTLIDSESWVSPRVNQAGHFLIRIRCLNQQNQSTPVIVGFVKD